MLVLAVAGASGRMGRMLVDAIANAPDATLGAALEHADAPSLGADAHGVETIGHVPIGADVDAALAASDVLIDFTRPEATMANLAACVRLGKRIVIGTTGFDEPGRATIAAAAEKIAVVFAPNMSVGVNVLLRLVGDAARALPGYDVEIVDAHHRHKVDAPSGTALELGRVVAAATGRDFDTVATLSREGLVGARVDGSIGFSAIRGGDIVGDHTVLFAGRGERIEITHRAASRVGYAEGALMAARFIATRPRGLFNMQDVLGLR